MYPTSMTNTWVTIKNTASTIGAGNARNGPSAKPLESASDYTTYTLSLNRSLRQVMKNCNSFHPDEAVRKLFYLALKYHQKKMDGAHSRLKSHAEPIHYSM